MTQCVTCACLNTRRAEILRVNRLTFLHVIFLEQLREIRSFHSIPDVISCYTIVQQRKDWHKFLLFPVCTLNVWSSYGIRKLKIIWRRLKCVLLVKRSPWQYVHIFYYVFHSGDKSKEERTEKKIPQLWNGEWKTKQTLAFMSVKHLSCVCTFKRS